MKRIWSAYLAAALLALTSAGFLPVHAQWSHDPWENNPVCEEEGHQYEPVIVDDGAGGCFVAWLDDRSAPTEAYVQRLDPSGEKLWAEYGVPVSESSFSKDHIRMVSDGGGGAIVVWEGGGSPTFIQAQRFSPNGSWLWGDTGVVVASPWYGVANPEITSDTFGGAVICWQASPSGNVILAQRLSSSGSKLWNADGVLLCNQAGNATDICISGLGGGGAVIAWTDTRNIDPRIYAQYVSSAGVCIWASHGMMATTTSTIQERAAITTVGSTVVLAFSNYDGYDPLYVTCQRLSLSGSRIWGSSGVRTSYDDNHQIFAHLIPDGAGGVFVAWTGYTGAGDVISVQRLTADGNRQWTSTGATASDYVSQKGGAILCADGQGGCIASWPDDRDYYGSVYAQRLDALGQCRWNVDDVQVSPATIWHWHVAIADDRGGLIAAWDDDREHENGDIYAQRVDVTGYLGEPQPVITAVTDFPNDQGGQVLVDWDRCYVDDWPWTAVATYSVWARDAGLRNGSEMSAQDCERLGQQLGLSPERIADWGRDGWTYVNSIPATQEPAYSCAAFTFGDSTGIEIPLAEYRILAHSSDPAIFWEAEPMAGYSVDNLAPGAPQALDGQSQGQGEVLLTWEASGHHDEDLSHYAIYRGTEPNVPLDPAHLVGTTSALTFVDPAGTGTWFYQATAVDVHQNESGGSNEIEVLVTSSDAPIKPELPATLALHSRGPNPFATHTTLVLELPRESEVEVCVCSADGRLVTVLDRGRRPAGRHIVRWDGRDAGGQTVAPGIYFCRVGALDEWRVRRVSLIR